MPSPIGEIIREWRALRRFSQLDLSLEAQTSARHLSFIESGRARPSREMVLRLADALAMPKATANRALAAAGFAPVFPQLAANAAELAPVRAAIETMLRNHEPFPAVAIDQDWTIMSANDAAIALFSALDLGGAGNMLEALLQAGDGDAIENWEETALLALQRVRAEIAALGGGEKLEALADALAHHKRLAGADLAGVNLNQAVIPTHFRLNGERLSMFSTIAQFGTVQDVGASELRIEMMFPADETTRRYFERG